jgi:pimeloyl-ACP methyl ester carboxylesterase
VDGAVTGGNRPTGALNGADDWADSVRDATVDGRRLRYVDAGSGLPLVLLHGIGGSWTHWSENLAALTAAGHRVVAVDMPGFGASEPLPPGVEMTATADVILQLLDQLQLDRVTVVGHSLGGLVSWLIAVRQPERVERLVLVDAATVKLPVLAVQAIIRSFSFMGNLLVRPAIARAVMLRPRLRHIAMSGVVADPASIPAALAVRIMAPMIDPPGFHDALRAAPQALSLLEPETMTIPTLLIWGTADRIFPVAAAQRLQEAMPKARLVEIRGAGHCPQFERPQEFDAALLAFVGES